MQHPYFANGFLGDGPPSPSPTRSKKRKRDINEEFDATPTKSRSRTASSQALGLPTPNEKHGSPLLGEQSIQDSLSFLSSGATKTPSSDSVGPLQQLTPPTSASPSIESDFRMSAQVNEASPTRTRASTMKSVQTTPNPALMLSIPSLVIQPPNSPMHIASLEAAVLSLRRLLSLNSSGSLPQPLPPEQECCAWIMFAELGMQTATSMDALLKPADTTEPSSAKTSQSTSASWAPKPEEIEAAISQSLRLADQIASLRPLRHQLTLMHAKIVFMQDNHKHSKVLLKRLLPLSTTSQHLLREKGWTSYEAHLSITDQILRTPLPSLLGVVDIQAASSQLMALNMLADQHGDFAVRQLTSVIRLTLLLQNYEVSDAIDGKDVDAALADAESLLSLDGFDKPNTSATDQQPLHGTADNNEKVSSSTPGATISSVNAVVTPLTRDILAGGGAGVLANLKTPAFSLPTNPLGMNIYSGEKQPNTNPESVPSTEPSTKIGTAPAAVNDDMIPPYLRYLRVQTLMAGVLWLTHCGNSARSAERLSLLHEMMDKLNDMSKLSGAGTGWSSDHDVGVIEVPLISNPERSLRIQATHPRVLYQLTFVISGIVKRDGAGKKPKRKIFAEEGLRIGRCDDVRVSHDSKPPITEGGSLLDLAPGLGVQALRQAQSSIQQIRATAYCELISACLIRSEFDEADQHLSDLVSFIRACDGLNNDPSDSLWDQYQSRITLLYGHLAHTLGQSRRALDCYRLVCHLEEEGSILWGMGLIGEIILRIGVAAMRKEPGQEDKDSINSSEKISPAGRFWRDGEREEVVQIASGVVEKCLSGLWGDHMAIIGRLIAASLSDEIVRTKQNLKNGLDLSCKSRDNYLRLIALILTTSQYIHTYSDYALTILETSKQIASSLGAVATAPAGKDGVDTASSEALRRSTRTSKGATEYHVGHARAGLWIGERFLELYKRKNEREKAGKQNALNVVFDKAVQELNSRTSSEEQITEFPSPILRMNGSKNGSAPPESKADANSHKTADASTPTLRIDTSSNFVRIKAARESTVSAGTISGISHNGKSTPGTTQDRNSYRHGHRQPESAISMSRSSIYSAAASTGTRRSARSAASKQAIVESDDEDADRNEDEYEEDDSDD